MENASYGKYHHHPIGLQSRLTVPGAGVCAERATICHAINMGHSQFKAIGITSDLTDEFITPCGICRQFIREFGKETPVYMFKGDQLLVMKLSELLPRSFGPEQLQ